MAVKLHAGYLPALMHILAHEDMLDREFYVEPATEADIARFAEHMRPSAEVDLDYQHARVVTADGVMVGVIRCYYNVDGTVQWAQTLLENAA
jgi:hypothetical protein